MAAVLLDNITKHYGKKNQQAPLILKGINAQIDDGEFIVVVGPSGCGKSTLLRVIAGLEMPTSGNIVIGHKTVTALEPSQRDIAMVFQNYALYPHMTVKQNMAYGIKLAKMPAHEIERRITQTAKMLDIDGILDKKPKQLSGGQRQRVAMGRAIVRQPRLFLFDEPLSNLDAKLRTSTRLEIRRRHHEIGITSLYVTHDQTEAMTLADRIIVMNKGKIEQFATPYDIYHQPASTFVASFMGSPAMNLLNVQIFNQKVCCDNTIFEDIIIPASIQNSGKSKWILGIRPEHLTIVPYGTKHAWQIDSTMVETLGAEQLIYAKIDTQPIIIRTANQSHLKNFSRQNNQLFLQLDQTKLHWFDAESLLSVAS